MLYRGLLVPNNQKTPDLISGGITLDFGIGKWNYLLWWSLVNKVATKSSNSKAMYTFTFFTSQIRFKRKRFEISQISVK